MRYKKLAILTAFLALFFIGAGETPPEEKAPKMTKEELKPKLGSKDLIVIDVRLDEIVLQALEKTGGNRTQAAKILEISLRSLIYKIKGEQILGLVEVALENAAQRLAHHGIRVTRRVSLSPEPAHGPHALRLWIPPSRPSASALNARAESVPARGRLRSWWISDSRLLSVFR